jgi:hypothetical protein
MATSTARSSRHITTLQDLLGLEREIIAAYQLAIDNIVDEPMTRDTIVSFHVDQQRHVRELETTLRALGSDANVSARGHLLMREPAAFAEAAGTTQVLELLKQNEEVAVRRYQQALHSDLPEDVADLVRRACNDQLRHRAWIAARVGAFTRSSQFLSGRTRESRPSIH